MACLLHNVGPSFNHWFMSVIATESGWIRMDFRVMSSGLFSFLWGHKCLLPLDWLIFNSWVWFLPLPKKKTHQKHKTKKPPQHFKLLSYLVLKWYTVHDSFSHKKRSEMVTFSLALLHCLWNCPKSGEILHRGRKILKYWSFLVLLGSL